MSDKNEARSQHSIIGYQSEVKPFERTTHKDAEWYFNPTNLGLFIHFGISTVHGDCDISWGMMENPQRRAKGNGIARPCDYWDFAKEFNPVNYDPYRWLKAVKDQGFTYAVLTTRHHDGFALWPSDVGELSTKNYMNGRDLVGEYVDACRKVGLKVGLYYSPPDWYFNRDYRSFMYGSGREEFPDRPHMDIYHNPIESVPEMPKEHEKAYCDYVSAQVRELLTRYGKIDLLWFDGSVDDTSMVIGIDEIRELQPSIVVNDRLWGTGDYCSKYECYLPKERPEAKYWEACENWHVGGGWSYVKNSDKFRTLDYVMEHYRLIRNFGGNYLLNIAPDKNGDVPENFYKALEDFGAKIREEFGEK